jgi:hypothetical protein
MLRMEKTASRKGEYVRMHLISCSRQPTRGSALVEGMSLWLTAHHQKSNILKNVTQGSGLDGFITT